MTQSKGVAAAGESKPSAAPEGSLLERPSSRRRTTCSHAHRTVELLQEALDLVAQDTTVCESYSNPNPSSCLSQSASVSGTMPSTPSTPDQSEETDGASPLPEVGDDCASIVSDMSSDGSFTFSSSHSSPRSIFHKYWEKHGHSPSLLSRAPIQYLSVPALSYGFNPLPSYEPSLLATPCLLREDPPSPPRRKIFGQGCWSKSEPLLNLNLLAIDSCFRKAHSWSALEAASASSVSKPQRSCLRQGRFSGAEPTSGVIQRAASVRKSLSRESSTTTAVETEDYSSDCSAVTFSRDVRVVVFDPPREIWAPSGWSAWFAV